MTFWEVVKVICNIPLGFAAICGCVVLGMVAFIVCCALCYGIVEMTLGRQNECFMARKWGDEDDGT